MIQRNFYPGDKWLYFKLYGNPAATNEILSEVLYPLIQELKQEDLISKWFFIRYSDPLPHLRIRFEINAIDSFGDIIMRLRSTLASELHDGKVYNIQIATYEREIERYGEDTMEECESFFFADSENIVGYIKNNLHTSEIGYILDSINWISNILSDIQFHNSKIIEFVSRMVNSYSAEMDLSIQQKVFMDSIYRRQKANIIKIIRKCDNAKPNCCDISWLISSDKKASIVASLIHMHLNRLFVNNQRIYELVIYYLLRKGYETLMYIKR